MAAEMAVERRGCTSRWFNLRMRHALRERRRRVDVRPLRRRERRDHLRIRLPEHLQRILLLCRLWVAARQVWVDIGIEE